MKKADQAQHPANPATVPIDKKKPDLITIDLSLEERANAGLKAAEKWDAIQALKEQVGSLNSRKKALQKDHDLLSKQALTGKAEVAADQVDMFRRPRGEEKPAAEQMDEMEAAAAESQGNPEVDELNRQAAAETPAPSANFEQQVKDFKAGKGKRAA